MEAKDAEIDRQQRELQTLRVRTYCYKVWFCSSNTSKSSEVDIFYKFMLLINSPTSMQQQAQEKVAEVQRELQALRVRNCQLLLDIDL